uniref:Uncharacterized protein n=1 Tax=viral metagenome TaxID=1070528 RepID=A0A6M3JW41_9ZZZZ
MEVDQAMFAGLPMAGQAAKLKQVKPRTSSEIWARKKKVKSQREKTKVRDTKIQEKRLEGKSMREIAKEVTIEMGVAIGPQAVANVLSRDDIKPIMEAQYLKIIGEIPAVTDRIIAKSRALDERMDDKINQNISWEANKLLAQTGGILIAPNQTNIHATFITQNNNVIPPVIADLMSRYFGDVIDVKPVEIPRIVEGEG